VKKVKKKVGGKKQVNLGPRKKEKVLQDLWNTIEGEEDQKEGT